jgi:hypothetical protein
MTIFKRKLYIYMNDQQHKSLVSRAITAAVGKLQRQQALRTIGKKESTVEMT